VAIWIGVDVGGTFTDLILYDDESGEVIVGKGLTTPLRPDEGVGNVLAASAQRSQLERAAFFMHGTTVGLNTLLEGKGAVIGLLATDGFRDVLEIRRGDRAEMFDLFWSAPPPLVPRRLRLPVLERMRADGTTHIPFDSTSAANALETFQEEGVEAIAVAFLNSHADPRHELAAEQVLRGLGFEGEISLSHRVSGEYREYERTSTTVIDAYIRPSMGRYLRRLQDRLRQQGFSGTCLITRSGGGAMTFEEAETRPFETIHSGPVAGVVGAADMCRRLGIQHAITADVGGTSFDTCLILGSRPQIKYEGVVAGRPVQAPWVDVRSVGAGGGSIAHVDVGGLLRVGPDSAGADPGPACYGRGGTQPAVTDAALVLGMLAYGDIAGGVRLDVDLARAALEPLGSDLSLEIDDVAKGILKIANSRMASALRQVSVEQGEDPRVAALIAFGGAGPLFGTLLVRELEIRKIVVPPYAGNFSAWGLLSQDVTRTAARTLLKRLDDSSLAAASSVLRVLFEELAARGGAETLDEREGSREAAFDMRYVGQEYTLTVPVSWSDSGLAADATSIHDLFTRQYDRAYGHTMDVPVEVVSARATVRLPLPRGRLEPSRARGPSSDEVEASIEAYSFTQGEKLRFSIMSRNSLAPETKLAGPLILLEETATTYVDAEFEVRVDPTYALIITDGGH
jgi:N-methylhydantoinase A